MEMRLESLSVPWEHYMMQDEAEDEAEDEAGDKT